MAMRIQNFTLEKSIFSSYIYIQLNGTPDDKKTIYRTR